MIDPADDLHAAIERAVAGLSPQERAERLIKMFGGPDANQPNSAAQPTPQGSFGDSGLWFTDKDGKRFPKSSMSIGSLFSGRQHFPAAGAV